MQQQPASGNPVIRYKYTADANALVANGKVYMYTGHDEAPPGTEEYIMHEWLCFSSVDLVYWEEHRSPLRARDFSWVKGGAWASQVVQRDDVFYWYAAVDHKDIPGRAIAVAVADRPEGPFKDARGSALISSDMLPYTADDIFSIDPTVLIDNTGQAYLFWGKNQCFYTRLKNNMIEVEGEIHQVYLPSFSEGAWLHQRNGWYYLLYGYKFPEKVAYAMSRRVDGPWVFKGILNEVAGNCATNRGSILEYNGQSYFIYHNGALPPDGGSHRRSVCVDHLYYNADGTLKRVVMTTEGVGQVS